MGEFLDKLLYGYNYKKHKKPEATLCENMSVIWHPDHKDNPFGVEIRIYSSTSDKHSHNTGKNEHRPPHAHFLTEDNKEYTFLLSNEIDQNLESYTSTMPTSKDDIKEMQGDAIPSRYKKMIFEYMTNKDYKDRYATNWEKIVDHWNDQNPSWELILT